MADALEAILERVEVPWPDSGLEPASEPLLQDRVRRGGVILTLTLQDRVRRGGVILTLTPLISAQGWGKAQPMPYHHQSRLIEYPGPSVLVRGVMGLMCLTLTLTRALLALMQVGDQTYMFPNYTMRGEGGRSGG